MKNKLLVSVGLALFAGCAKESPNNNFVNNNDNNLLTHKVKYSYIDTTTTHVQVNKNNRLRMFSTSPVPGLKVSYIGNNTYSLTATLNGSPSGGFSLYRNGVLYDSDPSENDPLTVQLIPGTYYGIISYIDSYYNVIQVQTPTLTIIDEPVAPAGMICLFRYYDPTNGQHICTYDWQELACASKGFFFEKVLGYTYPSENSAPNLKPIYRYYKASDGSHFTTDLLGNYSGYVYEKILGYVGTAPTTTLSRSLTKYYNTTIDDHFVCVAPDVPKGTAYTQDIDFVFGYLQ